MIGQLLRPRFGVVFITWLGSLDPLGLGGGWQVEVVWSERHLAAVLDDAVRDGELGFRDDRLHPERGRLCQTFTCREGRERFAFVTQQLER